MTTITFRLDDEFNKRTLEVKTTLADEKIDVYFEAFVSFLLAAGFARETIDRVFSE